MADLSAIVPPGDLVEVAIEMLLTDPVPHANHSATDLRMNSLGRIRMRDDACATGVAPNELARRMLDRDVGSTGNRLAVCRQGIGRDDSISRNPVVRRVLDGWDWLAGDALECWRRAALLHF